MFDDFDMFECCEEYYGEDYNLWEEEQCFRDHEEDTLRDDDIIVNPGYEEY